MSDEDEVGYFAVSKRQYDGIETLMITNSLPCRRSEVEAVAKELDEQADSNTNYLVTSLDEEEIEDYKRRQA